MSGEISRSSIDRHSAEAETLVTELTTALKKKTLPRQSSALAGMMAAIDRGTLDIGQEKNASVMQRIALRITMLEHRAPGNAALPRLVQIRDTFTALHKSRIKALLENIQLERDIHAES